MYNNYVNTTKEITPFNDIFISCFENPIYSFYNTFNNNILPLLVNNIIIYSNFNNTNDNGLIFLNLNKQINIFDILKNQGVEVNNLNYNYDIINILKKLLKYNNNYVFVPVDCFAIPNIPDITNNTFYFQKIHHQNFMLVYDIDEKKENLKVINSIGDKTKKRNYTYYEIKSGYECYINNYNNLLINLTPNISNYSTISNVENGDTIYKENYLNNILKNKYEIKNGIDNLYESYIFFMENTKNELLFKLLFENYFPIIPSKLVNYSKLQNYIHKSLFNNQIESINIRNKIADNWSFIRNIILKYNYSGIFRSNSLSTACVKFKEIYDLELKYYNWILNYR